MGHWLGFWDFPNYADPSFRAKVKKDVLDMVNTYKDEKGILLWILGNENNVSFSYSPQTLNLWTTPEIEALEDPYLKRQVRARIYYSFVNEVAQAIHEIDPNHPANYRNFKDKQRLSKAQKERFEPFDKDLEDILGNPTTRFDL